MIIDKKIGQFTIQIEGDQIAIIGNSGSNFGRVYEFSIDRWHAWDKKEGKEEYNQPQIFGFDWDYGLAPKVKAFLYELARGGRWNSL